MGGIPSEPNNNLLGGGTYVTIEVGYGNSRNQSFKKGFNLYIIVLRTEVKPHENILKYRVVCVRNNIKAS
jgi:hypothetical protein